MFISVAMEMEKLYWIFMMMCSLFPLDQFLMVDSRNYINSISTDQFCNNLNTCAL